MLIVADRRGVGSLIAGIAPPLDVAVSSRKMSATALVTSVNGAHLFRYYVTYYYESTSHSNTDDLHKELDKKIKREQLSLIK